MHRIHAIDMAICVAYTLLMWHFRPNVLDLSNWDLSLLEIRLIHNLGLMFIMNNVIPKYLRFTGARRHRNDMGVKKTYRTKNYLRLFLHILGGAGVFFFAGFYLQSEKFFQERLSLQTLKLIFIIFDLLHQSTIWLMLRNHDGIFVLRSNNLSLAVQKVAMDIALWEATSFEEARPIIAGLFLATAGFALTRFWCFIVAMAQVVCGRSFDSMRENWYSVGEWLAQLIIMVRMGVCRENNLCYIICVFWFPHELWNSKKDDFQDIAKYVAYVPAALYFYGFFADVTQRPLLTQTSDLVLQIALGIHSMYYCGKYFKREPLQGVDYASARKSMRSLVERTIVQARKSIFMYGNKNTANDMRPSRVQRLVKELDADATPVKAVPSPRGATTPLLPPPSRGSLDVVLTSPPESESDDAQHELTRNTLVNSLTSHKPKLRKFRRSSSVPEKRNFLRTSSFNSDYSVDSLADVVTPPVAMMTKKQKSNMGCPDLLLANSDANSDLDSNASSWQDPDGIPLLPRLSALVRFAEQGTPVTL